MSQPRELFCNIFHELLYHQLDAQTSCLFTYNTLIKIIYMFRAYPAHLQEVHDVIVYMQPLVSSLSAVDCLVHRCTGQSPAESDDTRGCIYTIRPPEDEQVNVRNM
jgi:hypothetical protein